MEGWKSRWLVQRNLRFLTTTTIRPKRSQKPNNPQVKPVGFATLHPFNPRRIPPNSYAIDAVSRWRAADRLMNWPQKIGFRDRKCLLAIEPLGAKSTIQPLVQLGDSYEILSRDSVVPRPIQTIESSSPGAIILSWHHPPDRSNWAFGSSNVSACSTG